MNPNYVFVAGRARHICEYCGAPEAVFNLPFEVEHIVPLARGGKNFRENLALSCRSCNLYKSHAVSGFDETAQQESRFFNPHADVWAKHFALEKTNAEIEGLTVVGRVTIAGLRMNSRAQTAARLQWLKLGFFD